MRADKKDNIVKNYAFAKEAFAEYGVDTDKVLKFFSGLKMSVHCWQGDDVTGFEKMEGVTSQNVVTGAYPGAAKNGDQLRADIDKALSYSPFSHKINLHSMYAEGKNDRSKVEFSDFSRWVDWAKEKGYGLDFNASFFTHPMMDNGMSLASRKKEVRDYWIEAGIGARKISYEMGKATGQVCVNNIWVPDGLKDLPADRLAYRELLTDSLNKVLAQKYDRKYMIDALEGKLFSIGVESFTVGSHDFYQAYSLKNNVGICMDIGHYHATESAADKVSALAPFYDDILLHITRGVRWDSDHVVLQSDEVLSLFEEIHRGNFFDKFHMGLDFFDASINRIAAWAVGLRATAKSLLTALLEPVALLKKAEESGDFTRRLVLTDEMKNLPVNAVWDYLLLSKDIAAGAGYVEEIKQYEKDVLLKR